MAKDDSEKIKAELEKQIELAEKHIEKLEK